MKTRFSAVTLFAFGTLFGLMALFAPAALHAQATSSVSYLPILQATDAGDLGLAFSNPTVTEASVTLTARTYSGETISGADIMNPATIKLPPSGQRALRAVEMFGNGITGKTGWIEVRASSPAVKGFFLLFDSRVSFIDGAEMQSTTSGRIIFPKVTIGATTATNISFIHTGNQTIRFASVTLYDNSGKIVARQYVSLGPQSGFSGPITALVPTIQSFDGYAVVETAGTPFSGIVETLIGFETYREKSDMAALNAVAETTAQRIGYLPHLASQAGYRTTLSLVNYTGQAQTVKVTASGLEANGAAQNPACITVDRVIPAFGRLSETADTMFGLSGTALIAGYIKWEVQGNSAGLIGSLDYGTTDGILLSAVPAQTTSYSDLFFSHIAEGLGYYTGLAFLNPNTNNSTVNIEVFNREGRSVGKTTFTLAAGERRSRLMRELIQAVTDQLGGYVRVTASRPIFAFQLFGSSSSLSFLANVSAQGIQLLPQASGRSVSASTGATVVASSSAATIAIPPGALSSDTVISLGAPAVSVPSPSSNEKVVASVEALPSGTQFNIPVTLTIPLAAQLDPGTTIKLLIFDSVTGKFTDSGFTATVDDSGRTASGQVTHFTTYVGSVSNDVLLNVTGVSPASGRPGASVTIGGAGFSTTADNNIVTFAGADNTAVRGVVTAASATSLTVTVPPTAVTGSVIVRVGAKSSIGVLFTVDVDKPKPSLSSIGPTSFPVAASSFEIRAVGTGFHSASVIRVDGIAVSTTYVDATLLLGVLSGAAAGPGIHRVSVFTPPSGGGESDFKELTIGFPVPAITSISPTSAANNVPTIITITGTGFTASSTVSLDSAVVSSTFVSSASIQATLISSSSGNRLVTVSNPAPGGGQSNSVAFTFTGPATPPVTGIVLITASGTSAMVGATVPLTVELRNAGNQPFPGQTASFVMSSGNGSISSPSVSDSLGRITVTVTLGTTAGLNRVLITAGSASATYDATGLVGPATKLTLSRNPASFAAGSTGSVISARVEDQYGNLRTANTDTINFAITAGTGNLSAPSAIASAGVASVTLTSNTTGAITVQGTAGGLTAASTSATVTPGPPTSMSITGGNTQNGQAGVALATPLKVLIKDAFNNVVPNVSVTFSVVTGGGSVNPLTAMTDANGEAQTTATPGSLVGTQTFRAAAASLANADFSSTIAAGPAKSILLTAADSSRVAGVTTNLTVTVRDQFGNTVLNAATVITLSASPSSSVAFGTTTPLLTNGVGSTTFAATTVNAGYTLTAASTGLTSGTTSVAVTPDVAAKLVPVSGDGQTTVKGTALPLPLVVKVTDQYGNAVQNVGVTFAATSGGTVSNTGSQNTDANGQASVNANVPNVVGAHTFTATSGTLTGSPVPFSATATNAPPTSVGLSSTNSVAAVDTTQTFSVVVKDANNNTVSLVNVNFAVTAGNGTVQNAANAIVQTDSNGVASATIKLGQTAGTNTFTATVSGLTPVTLSVNGIAGAPAKLTVSSGAASVIANTNTTLTITVKDAFNNTVTTASNTISLAANPTSSVSFGTVSALTNGVATATFKATTATSYTITASSSGLTDGTVGVSATPATASKLAVSAAASVAPNTNTTLTITVQDAFGNTVTTASNTITVAANPSSTVTFGTVSAVANGIATVTFKATTSIGYTITAASSGLTDGTLGITVSSGVPAKVAISAGPSSVGANTNTTLTITVQDAFGNTVTTASNTITLAANPSSSVTLGTVSALTNGVATATFKATTATGYTVTASSSGLTDGTAGVTVTPGAGAKLTLSAGAASVAANANTTLTITVQDAFNNTVTTAGNSITLAANPSSSVTFGTVSALTNGVATATFKATTATGYTVTASSSGLTDGTAGVTVIPGAAAKLSVGASSTSVAPNTNTTLTITVQDAFNNTVTGSSDVITLLSNNGGTFGTVSGPTNGVATATFKANTAQAYHLTASSGALTAGTIDITVVAGSLTTVALSVSPTTAAANVNRVVTIKFQDDFGNTVTTAANDYTLTLPAGVSAVPGFTRLNGVVQQPVSANTVGDYTISVSATGLTSTAPVTITVVPAASAKLAISAAGSPAANTNTTLTITVQDAFNNIVTNSTDTISLASTGASFTFGSVSGPTNGVATATFKATTATNYTITASSGSLTSANVAVAVTPAAASKLAINAAPNSVAANVNTTLTVTVQDAFNNTVTNSSDAIGLASTGASFTLGSVSGPANGVATATFKATTANGYTITATSGSLTSASVGVTVTNTSAAKLVISASSTSIAANLNTTLTITVQDAFGNPVTDSSDAISLGSTGASFTFGTISGPTNGVATATFKATTAASYTVTATSGSLTSANVGVTVNPATAAKLAISAASSSVAADVSTTLTITVQDAFNNTVTTSSDTIGLASSGASFTLGAVSGPTNGVATATFKATTAANYTITATSGSLTSANVIVGVTNGAAAKLAISAASSTIQAGVNTTLTITVQDAFNNTVTNSSATIGLGSTGASFTFGTVSGPTNGVATATFKASTPATYTITATSGSLTSATVNVTVDLTASVVELVAGDGQTVAPGISLLTPLKVRVKNAGGIVVPNTTVNWAAATGGGSVSAPTSLTDSNGDAVITATVGAAAGANTFTATVGSLTPVTFTGTSKTLASSPVFIDVAINSGAAGVGSYSLQINFDKNLVQLTAANIVNGNGSGYSITAKNLNTPGVLILNGFSQDVPAGSYTVARITFTPIRPGTVTLTTQDVLVTDAGGFAINPAFLSLTNTTLTIN